MRFWEEWQPAFPTEEHPGNDGSANLAAEALCGDARDRLYVFLLSGRPISAASRHPDMVGTN